jgi:hypothetical protein
MGCNSRVRLLRVLLLHLRPRLLLLLQVLLLRLRMRLLLLLLAMRQLKEVLEPTDPCCTV